MALLRLLQEFGARAVITFGAVGLQIVLTIDRIDSGETYVPGRTNMFAFLVSCKWIVVSYSFITSIYL